MPPTFSALVRRGASLDLAAGALAALAFAAATWWLLDLPATFFVHLGALYAILAGLVLAAAPPALPGPGLGPANRITLIRAALVLTLAVILYHPSAIDTAGRWWVVATGTAVMVLDGLDGWVARRTGTATDFGARFDMETDALLMLVLSATVWIEGRAGAWVLLIGGMRYLFVSAGLIVPRLRAPLFPSLRRRVVCVVQGVGLLVCLGPVIPGPLGVAAAALALASLAWSFGVDTLWLLRREPT
jgi:phosphatidylglycerophosphate synthase